MKRSISFFGHLASLTAGMGSVDVSGRKDQKALRSGVMTYLVPSVFAATDGAVAGQSRRQL